MPRINTYTDNTTIEDDDKLLTYDTQGAATKLTAFSRIWTWVQAKFHALAASSTAWNSNDKMIVDRNGTIARVDASIPAKNIVETYNGSTLAGTAQSVKAAIDGLNTALEGLKTVYKGSLAASGTGASVSITGAGTHCIYIVAVGNWNASRILVVYPGNGGDVRVKPLSWYANSDTAPSDIVTITAGSGTSGITIANASSNACPLTVFAIVKSN